MSEEGPPPVALDLAIAALQARVGDRVRAARATRRMSRRALSEASGVSPRYLAQLESGEGNISIALLLRVAMALDLRIEALVADLDADAVGIAARFAKADPTLRARVSTLLTSSNRAGRICLIGLRGAGKSTLGAAVGRALDLPFIELNKQIEAAAGIPIGEVMALYGADGYRQLEADALDDITDSHARVVVAVAGGIVAEAPTFDRLLDRFHTVWLRAAPEDHMARVQAQGDTRPMEGNPQAMTQLRLLLQAREADYARADAVLTTSGLSVDEALQALLALIERHGYLPPADTPPKMPKEGPR